jgi:hypothetical protein
LEESGVESGGAPALAASARPRAALRLAASGSRARPPDRRRARGMPLVDAPNTQSKRSPSRGQRQLLTRSCPNPGTIVPDFGGPPVRDLRRQGRARRRGQQAQSGALVHGDGLDHGRRTPVRPPR